MQVEREMDEVEEEVIEGQLEEAVTEEVEG